MHRRLLPRHAALAVALALASLAAVAQPGPPGAGPRASAPGGGMGPGHMMGRWGPDHTPGWSLMTEQERLQHQERLRAAKTADECRAEMERHRAQMAERAKERGQTLPTPRRDACAGWK